MLDLSIRQFRRLYPRVAVNALCSEMVGEVEQHSIMIDLSAGGLRVQRPDGIRGPRRVALELELPDLDEVIWIDGEICFESVHETSTPEPSGLTGRVRTSGIRILETAEAHRRLLRDYVHYVRNELTAARDTEWCNYLPGVSMPRQW